MPLTDAQGNLIGKAAAAATPITMGFSVFKKEPGGLLSPLVTANGDFGIIATQEDAIKTAQAMAQAELVPNEKQKVVTPQMKSAEYFVVQLVVLGQVQAKFKDPAQILAPEGKLNG